MGHKNYKWNMSKEQGKEISTKYIKEILNEKKDHSIHYQELLLLLQNRTQTLNITQNKKPKTLLIYLLTPAGTSGLFRPSFVSSQTFCTKNAN